ncbi:MAG: oligosaccharide flippase family protein [Polyangia bacterium]
MSLIQKVVRGAAWTTLTALLARLASLVATLLVTHKIAPKEYGEASAAIVVVLSANSFSTLFITNFVIIDRAQTKAAAYVSNIIHQATGLIGMLIVIPLTPWLAVKLNAPDIGRYLPLTILSFLMLRLSSVPEKILVRDLRFRYLALGRMAAEILYSIVTIVTAYRGWGGSALIAGVVARTGTKALMFCFAVPWREWLEPQPFDTKLARRMFSYGAPLWIAGVMSYIGSNWDNLLVSHYFDAGVMAIYSLGFNLAEMPAVQIGEQLCEVLLPSFAILEGERRRQALVKALLVVCLVTFPFAIGLGATSYTLVHAFFDPRWWAVSTVLTLLCLRSITRIIIYPLIQYFQATDRNRDQMFLSVFTTIVVLGTMIVLGSRSLVVTCTGVVIAYTLQLVPAFFILRREGIPPAKPVLGLLRLGVACVALAMSVLAVRTMLGPHLRPVVLLLAEIVAGAAGYVIAALIVARPIANDLLSWLRRGLGRGSAAADTEATA